MIERLALGDIVANHDTQARVQLDWVALDEYAHAMREGAEFPAVIVYYDNAQYWLADGFHRVEAAKAAGLDTVRADVRQGGRRDAILHACGANADHGVRRTNADKRRAVELLLKDEEWRAKGNRWIARQCVVGEATVRRVFAELSASEAQIQRPDTRLAQRNGTTYTIDTTNIGRGAEAPDDYPRPSVMEGAQIVKGPAGDYWQGSGRIKQCARCGRMWGAEELDYCPYCHISPEARMAHVAQERKVLPLTAANHAPSLDPNYDGDEWYTPVEYIEAARRVMGGIDVDPASCDAAQRIVRAGEYYTKDDDGLCVTWYGRVWLNPPYSTPLIQEFVSKVIGDYDAGHVDQAVVLTNNSSDTRWFHQLLSRFPTCFTRGRVQFWRPDSSVFGARQGQALFYLGDQRMAFVREFSQFGQVVSTIDNQ